MKSIILAITLTAFTVGAFAGGDACCAKEKAACADKNKTACAGKAAAGCPSKGKCPAGGETAKASSKKVQSPKDAAASKS